MSGLKRYTELPYLLHMLSTRSITLLNPVSWEDRNDAYFLKRYVERCNLKSVQVMCLTKSAATYHHWHVFAHNASGVRIEFNESLFAQWVEQIAGARLERVKYFKMDMDLLEKIPLRDLPFAKRHAFRHENEIRLLVEDANEILPFRAIPFNYGMIKEVILSPWLAQAAVPSVQQAIWAAADGAAIKVRRTAMLESKKFMGIADYGE